MKESRKILNNIKISIHITWMNRNQSIIKIKERGFLRKTTELMDVGEWWIAKE
jgi:hypothetical protein